MIGIRFGTLVGGLALLASACISTQDPGTLVGTWTSTNAPARLELRGSSWMLESGSLVKWGVYEVSEDRIALLITDVNHAAFREYCRDVADVYAWRVEGGLLRLEVVGEYCDPVAESVLIAGPWEREAPA